MAAELQKTLETELRAAEQLTELGAAEQVTELGAAKQVTELRVAEQVIEVETELETEPVFEVKQGLEH